MKLVAIKDHSYRGRPVRVGQKYDAPPADANILIRARLARPASSETRVEKKVIASAPQPAPPPVVEESLDIEPDAPQIETREEMVDEDQENIDYSQQPSSRRQRRQYKRKDLVPEK